MQFQVILIVLEALSLVFSELSVIPGSFKIYGCAAQILHVQLFGDPDHDGYNPLIGLIIINRVKDNNKQDLKLASCLTLQPLITLAD